METKLELDWWDNPDEWESDSEVDPNDTGEQWRDVIDAGRDWIVVVDGATYIEPKRKIHVYYPNGTAPRIETSHLVSVWIVRSHDHENL